MLRRGASWSRRRCEAAAQPQGACHAPPPPSPSSPFPFPHPPPLTPTACSRAARAAAGGPPWPAGEPRRGAGAAGIVPHPALLLALQPPGGCDGPVGRAAPSAACAAPRVGSGPRGPGPAMCSCDPPPHTCVPLVFVMFPPTHPWAAAAQPPPAGGGGAARRHLCSSTSVLCRLPRPAATWSALAVALARSCPVFPSLLSGRLQVAGVGGDP
jgi:hypothetical protein